MTAIVIWIIRLLLGVLVLFELAGYLGLLPVTVEYTWLGLVITALVSIVILEAVGRHFRLVKKRDLHWSIWLIALAALAVDAAGDILHLYGQEPWWDQLVHLTVSAVVSFCLFAVINAFWIDQFKFKLLWQSGRMKLAALLSTSVTTSLGVLYEIEEYAEDLIWHTRRLGPGPDTANDLLFNFLGVILSLFVIVSHYLITRKRAMV